jgi:murein DD-endopeptidase MepM/ murein hydrolase activator NlpD
MSALIESFFYCLFASMIWAPAIFFTADALAARDKRPAGAHALSGKVWPAALILAALPVLAAPIAAAFGFSLRSPAPLPPMAEFAGPAIAAVEGTMTTASDTPHTATLADVLRTAAMLYLYGFAMLLALAAIRHIWFAYRLNFAAPIDEPALEAALEHWRQRVGVARRPRYVFSHIVSSVCVYGFFRPVVVMPYNLLDRVSIEDAALMGAHEMAHVKRGDVALFALCSVAKAVFWFNPFIHRICARATLAAEQGADALVLARGVSRRQYAHCFVQGLRLAAGARSGFAGELIPSFTPFDKRSRRARLDAILSGAGETALLTLTHKIALGAGVVVAAGLAFAQAAFAVSPPPAKEALPVAPVEGEITLGYGVRVGALGPDRPAHEGIDIKAARGTPVRAAGAGKVVDATDRYRGADAWGKVVVIDHGHGLVTRYAHLDSYVVRKGDAVDAGDVIAAVGSTGKVTGPHLHFEVIEDGAHIDPTPVAADAPEAAAPAPREAIRTTRNVQLAATPEPAVIAPAPELVIAPEPPVTPRPGKVSEKQAHKLQKQLSRLDERLRIQFANFNAFDELDGVVIDLSDFEFDGFEDLGDLEQRLEGQQLRLRELSDVEVVLPDMASLLADVRLSDEEIEDIRREHEEAVRKATQAIERAREDLAETEEARREAAEDMRERELERAERNREWTLALREAKRERDTEMLEFKREAARARARAERDRVRGYATVVNEEELLDRQEEAIRNAKEALEAQLAQIEERRQELQRGEE